MTRFAKINNEYINVEDIRSFNWCMGNVSIEHIDGICETYPNMGLFNELTGQKHIIQVFPCTEPLYAVYDVDDPDDPEDSASKAICLALCADGTIYPVELCDGSFDIPSPTSNYVGTFRESELSRFKNLKVY